VSKKEETHGLHFLPIFYAPEEDQASNSPPSASKLLCSDYKKSFLFRNPDLWVFQKFLEAVNLTEDLNLEQWESREPITRSMTRATAV